MISKLQTKFMSVILILKKHLIAIYFRVYNFLTTNIFLLSLGINIILFSIFFIFVHPAFGSNDDIAMMTFASGLYSGAPSEYLIYINVLMGMLMKFLYINFPQLNWYPILFYLFHFASMVAILYVVLRHHVSVTNIVLYLLFFVFMEVYLMSYLQFTTTAFVAGTGGLLLLLTFHKDKSNKAWLAMIIGIVLLFISSLIRINSFYLLLVLAIPVVTLISIFTRSAKLLLLVVLALMLVITANQYNDYYYQQSPQWSYYQQYNKLRQYITDYPNYQYSEQTKDVYRAVGWSENDVSMFRSWSFADKEIFSLDDLSVIVSNIKLTDRSYEDSLATFTNTIEIVQINSIYFVVIFLAAALIFSQKTEKMYLFLALLAALAASAYFSHIGRLPDRVFFPILFFLGSISLFFISKYSHKLLNQSKAQRIIKAVIITGLLILIIPVFWTQAEASKENINLQKDNRYTIY